MFKTAPKQPLAPRPAFTAQHEKRPRFHPTPPELQHKHSLQKQSRLTTLRPQTTPLIQPLYSTLAPPAVQPQYCTLDTTGGSRWVSMRTMNEVEGELQDQYQDEMCGYLRRKLRLMVGRRQVDLAKGRYLSSTIENCDMDNTTRSSLGPLDQFYSTFRRTTPVRVEKGVEEAYVNIARERVVRLIERKREQEGDFKELSGSITRKWVESEDKKGRSKRGQFNVVNVEQEGWDKEWREETGREAKRYRNRLLMKCHRKNQSIDLVFNK